MLVTHNETHPRNYILGFLLPNKLLCIYLPELLSCAIRLVLVNLWDTEVVQDKNDHFYELYSSCALLYLSIKSGPKRCATEIGTDHQADGYCRKQVNFLAFI